LFEKKLLTQLSAMLLVAPVAIAQLSFCVSIACGKSNTFNGCKTTVVTSASHSKKHQYLTAFAPIFVRAHQFWRI